MVITESELRELWRDGRHALPAFPPGTRFSPAAQDFLKDHNLEIRFAHDGTGSTGPVSAATGARHSPPTHPDSITNYQLPITLLPRLESLHALIMLAAAEARRYQLPQLAAHLDVLAAYCHEVQAAVSASRPVPSLTLAGKSEDEIDTIARSSGELPVLARVVPGPSDHAILHWLNVLRTQAREAESMALEAAGAGQGAARALNHLSSAVRYLALLFEAGMLAWKAGYGS